ncbi:hypothetical protein A1O1_06570 [Capronia coronata CBS 617.96]|uniref:CCZ1/INTU/HSP4 first Longin domain-containing protein n=1 Tax=Capronia coronata CBS 617.96 TaxID=1182541 RepID=W9Y967_9EURO|nr:uncharacterized protein A1O1_06570 [Capronia coronata CBS 617.96]EXJ86200.1 hypothetical protein A1O1_06570 [Capronia coronata CBS 617.96]
MSSYNSHSSRIVPAHVSYLAIYNPSLGSTDETVGDQIVFYHSAKLEAEHERRSKQRVSSSKSQHGTPGKEQEQPDAAPETHQESEQYERQRQVGLAQGMVDFVKTFSNGAPLESIETEKSRVVLKELEPQWWILASISLTRMPATVTNSSPATRKASNIGKDYQSAGPASAEDVEYSSREVAPAHLLLAQLMQAYRGFLLHHASCLAELWKRHENNRDFFCSILNRYWSRFVRDWDVLLHGNPAAAMYDAVKLAGGGELGIGVGEEEWGSGEREVLEGFAGRTEGLLDLIVGRYGDAPLGPIDAKQSKDVDATTVSGRLQSEPWLGNGDDPRAQDGIIFSGMGAVSRRSLITLSQWMEDIYVHGDAAYGVGENPASRPRHRRNRRRAAAQQRSDSTSPVSASRTRQQHHEEVSSRGKPSKGRAPDLRRKAMENNAIPPGIPAPLVSAVEQSLDAATMKASWTEQRDTDNSEELDDAEHSQKPHGSSSLFGRDKMLKYLSLGYGSSWTLNPKGFAAERTPVSSDVRDTEPSETKPQPEDSSTEEPLQALDPTPEVSDEEGKPFVQRLEQSIGKFLIGLSGDLENTEFDTEPEDEPADRDTKLGKNVSRSSSPPPQSTPNRIFLRTLLIEMSSSRFSHLSAAASLSSQAENRRADENDGSPQVKTSAAASVDGSKPNITHEKVQVAVYVHQPFIFVFLFRLHTSNLSMPEFYRSIHHTLGPLQKSLMRSTDPERWRERVMETLEPGLNASAEVENTTRATTGSKDTLEVFDLVYDPDKMTIRTSIPNIPLPGSLAAEGLHRTSRQVQPVTVSGSWYTLGIPIGTSSPAGATSPSSPVALVKSNWTRVEALNVHTHILNIWAGTRYRGAGISLSRSGAGELERTVKTARGWWVVWMKVLASSDGEPEVIQSRSNPSSAKEAILVRRSPQERVASSRDPSGARFDARALSSTGKWLLRDQPRTREVSGSGSGTGSSPTNAKGVNEGVGVDARKWVESLVKLSM